MEEAATTSLVDMDFFIRSQSETMAGTVRNLINGTIHVVNLF
jgi:hypothetical protein